MAAMREFTKQTAASRSVRSASIKPRRRENLFQSAIERSSPRFLSDGFLLSLLIAWKMARVEVSCCRRTSSISFNEGLVCFVRRRAATARDALAGDLKVPEDLAAALRKNLEAHLQGDFCWSLNFAPRFVAALCAEGFLPICCELGGGTAAQEGGATAAIDSWAAGALSALL